MRSHGVVRGGIIVPVIIPPVVDVLVVPVGHQLAISKFRPERKRERLAWCTSMIGHEKCIAREGCKKTRATRSLRELKNELRPESKFRTPNLKVICLNVSHFSGRRRRGDGRDGGIPPRKAADAKISIHTYRPPSSTQTSNMAANDDSISATSSS